MASTMSDGVAMRRGVAVRPEVPTVSVVIPSLNEAPNLPFVLSTLAELEAEIILIDGRSVDDTVRVAKTLRPDIVVVEQLTPGKGAALRAGFEAATGDIIVMMDSDGSTDGREIPLFVSALMGGADFAKGSRFMPGGGSADITRVRQTGNRCLSGLVNLVFGARSSDLCYGFNAFWRDCLPYLNVDCDGFEVETLLNIRAIQSGLRIVEVPSYESARIHGVSNLNAARDGIRVLRVIATARKHRVNVKDVPQPGRCPLRPALSR
jgi:glycosyltransferase involved in cell wall biosynthesis